MIELTHDTVDIFVPDGLPIQAALARTTHLAIAAHLDELEILAVDAINGCMAEVWRYVDWMLDGDKH